MSKNTDFVHKNVNRMVWYTSTGAYYWLVGTWQDRALMELVQPQDLSPKAEYLHEHKAEADRTQKGLDSYPGAILLVSLHYPHNERVRSGGCLMMWLQEPAVPAISKAHYPHLCPDKTCASAAYMGAVPADADCSNVSCRYHRRRG